MLIAQISDTHLKAPSARLFGSIDIVKFFSALVERVEGLDPKPDLVIHTGDIANDGEYEAYEAALGCLSKFSMPVLVTVGNHDNRDVARTSFSGRHGSPECGRFAYVVDDFLVRIVILDTLVEGESHGKLGETQLGWLDKTLDAKRDKPTVVALHHPPFATGLQHMDRIGLRDADQFAQIISRYSHVERVLAGHVHRSFTTRFAGTVATTCPGSAHQIAFSLVPDAPAAWTIDSPGFQLHNWTGRNLVSVDLPAKAAAIHSFSNAHTFVDER